MSGGDEPAGYLFPVAGRGAKGTAENHGRTMAGEMSRQGRYINGPRLKAATKIRAERNGRVLPRVVRGGRSPMRTNKRLVDRSEDRRLPADFEGAKGGKKGFSPGAKGTRLGRRPLRDSGGFDGFRLSPAG